MYRFRTAKLVAAAVAELESEAIRQWHAENSRTLALEEALTSEIFEIHTTVLRRREGRISVTISVLARNPYQSDTYWYPLQTKGNSVVRVTQAS